MYIYFFKYVDLKTLRWCAYKELILIPALRNIYQSKKCGSGLKFRFDGGYYIQYDWLLIIFPLTDTDMVIIYLSSGITSRDSSEHEKRATLSVVKDENRHLNNSVMILTYALMNGEIFPRREAFLLALCPVASEGS